MTPDGYSAACYSGATRGPCIGHVCPEAADGGPLALVRDGDRVRIDLPDRVLDLLVPAEELERRRHGPSGLAVGRWHPSPAKRCRRVPCAGRRHARVDLLASRGKGMLRLSRAPFVVVAVIALSVVSEFTVPVGGFKVAKRVAAFALRVVRGESFLSFATLLLSGHSSLSGGGPLSLVTLKTKRNSCLLSRWA